LIRKKVFQNYVTFRVTLTLELTIPQSIAIWAHSVILFTCFARRDLFFLEKYVILDHRTGGQGRKQWSNATNLLVPPIAVHHPLYLSGCQTPTAPENVSSYSKPFIFDSCIRIRNSSNRSFL